MKDIFLIDFDGTIAINDSTQVLAKEFIYDMYEDYTNRFRRGEVNVKQYIHDLLSSLNIDKEKFRATLHENIKIDKSFANFINNDIEFRIVSSGTKLNVIYSLESVNIFIKDEHIYSNEISFDNSNITVISPILYMSEENGVNKATIVKKYINKGYRVFFIGDGPSDYEVARVANIIFAKKGKRLAKRCEENNVPYIEFENFDDIYNKYNESFYNR